MSGALRVLARLTERRTLRRLGLAALAGVAVSVFTLALAVAFEPLPAALVEKPKATSLRLLDRHGRLLREIAGPDGRRSQTVTLAEVSPHVVAALLAAEDRRFFVHPGVDPLAIARAVVQALAEQRVVSGASTLTQQLARRLVPRERSLSGKLREAVVALRIEASLDKEQILSEYLNRIEFGPGLLGIEAASARYFDKPALRLDLAEAAALVALVRSPSAYDPRKGTERLRRRRDRVLRRMELAGAADPAVIARALRAPLRIRAQAPPQGVEHAAFAIAAGRLAPGLAGSAPNQIETTLDGELQRDVEGIARLRTADLERVGASALSILVIDNATADVLAYVGSPDYFAASALGANDGVHALRQPGSTLKPFVYAAAMERLHWTAATLLPDLGLVLATPNGPYAPKNYDGREHGPVRLRVALASSLNLPALRAATLVGPDVVLAMLRRFGFDSLSRDAAHYGAAIALGDGEVRLSELAAAYSALARDGEWRALRLLRKVAFADGESRRFEAAPPRRVVSRAIAQELTSILSDDRARRPSFGAESVLAFEYPVAAKTGTSKGFRDNFALGYTREVTVAVWVGNFDGRPMRGSSGISGAGPVFHDVLERAMRGRAPAPLVEPDGFVEREICPLSGALPSNACPHRVRERFRVGAAPHVVCAFHERVPIDPRTGERACTETPTTELRVFERYPREYEAWARAAGRPLAPAVPEACRRSGPLAVRAR